MHKLVSLISYGSLMSSGYARGSLGYQILNSQSGFKAQAGWNYGHSYYQEVMDCHTQDTYCIQEAKKAKRQTIIMISMLIITIIIGLVAAIVCKCYSARRKLEVRQASKELIRRIEELEKEEQKLQDQSQVSVSILDVTQDKMTSCYSNKQETKRLSNPPYFGKTDVYYESQSVHQIR